MTSREVVDSLLRGRKAGRIVLRDIPWPDTIAAWVQQGYPARLVYKEAGEEHWHRETGQSERERTGSR